MNALNYTMNMKKYLIKQNIDLLKNISVCVIHTEIFFNRITAVYLLIEHNKIYTNILY